MKTASSPWRTSGGSSTTCLSPPSAVKYVQVAGTNGKGSTSHFIAAILRAAGWRVGLFTSPHLQDVRERISLNGRMISRNDFAAALSAVDDIGRDLRRRRRDRQSAHFFRDPVPGRPVPFQQEQRADWAVLEVGLGGRLDATSTVIPEVAVITNIAMDHTHILGKTLSAIAREKAGVCRKNVPLVSGCPHGSVAARVIAGVARETGAPWREVFPPGGRRCRSKEKAAPISAATAAATGDTISALYLKGRHQTVNAAVAVKTVEVLRELGWSIPDAAIGRGIRDMFIPARIEYLGGRPPLILDGGHNPAGIKVLVDFLREENIRGFTPDLRRPGGQAVSGHGPASWRRWPRMSS